VGVGEVIGERCRASEYRFATEQGNKTLPELASREHYPHLYRHMDGDEDDAEYLVPVRWLHTVSREDAFSEVGLFGNQKSSASPPRPSGRIPSAG